MGRLILQTLVQNPKLPAVNFFISQTIFYIFSNFTHYFFPLLFPITYYEDMKLSKFLTVHLVP